MEGRVNKNYDNDNILLSRVNRNSRLYDEVYNEHGDLENFPLADNTKDIDINKLKELISSMNEDKESDISNEYDDSFWENKKRYIDDNRVYDINKMLEKAKYENDKLKDSESELLKISRNILSRLNIDDYETNDKYNDKSFRSNSYNKDDNLEMTREMKYHTKQINNDPLIEQVMPDNDLAMDLFFELKPTGNTIVTKPIKESDSKVNKDNVSVKEIDTKSIDDTSDIDIIKKGVGGVDKDFFTSSYTFSDSDFSDDELTDNEKLSGIIKNILLVIGIILLVGVILFFIIYFGTGI